MFQNLLIQNISETFRTNKSYACNNTIRRFKSNSAKGQSVLLTRDFVVFTISCKILDISDSFVFVLDKERMRQFVELSPNFKTYILSTTIVSCLLLKNTHNILSIYSSFCFLELTDLAYDWVILLSHTIKRKNKQTIDNFENKINKFLK